MPIRTNEMVPFQDYQPFYLPHYSIIIFFLLQLETSSFPWCRRPSLPIERFVSGNLAYFYFFPRDVGGDSLGALCASTIQNTFDGIVFLDKQFPGLLSLAGKLEWYPVFHTTINMMEKEKGRRRMCRPLIKRQTLQNEVMRLLLRSGGS